MHKEQDSKGVSGECEQQTLRHESGGAGLLANWTENVARVFLLNILFGHIDHLERGGVLLGHNVVLITFNDFVATNQPLGVGLRLSVEGAFERGIISNQNGQV
jgi:hypothetical protein